MLPDGYWQCGLPGDALGVAFRVDDRISFSTVPNSSYRARDGRGTYLLTGETVVFTRGPLKGLRMMWESADRLRADAAHESGGRLLCNRRAHRGDNPVNRPAAADRD